MIVFELRVDGELVARAGSLDPGVLSHTVTARGILGEESVGTSNVKEGCRLETGLTGLTSRDAEAKNVHMAWYSNRSLRVGDELTLRIAEGTDTTVPEVLSSRESQLCVQVDRWGYASINPTAAGQPPRDTALGLITWISGA